MATVADTFVESSTVDLDAHTPTGSNAGTSWVEIEQSSTQRMQVDAALDQVVASAVGSTQRHLCTIRPSPTQTSYDTTVTLVAIESGSNIRPAGILGYLTDASNWYAAGAYRAAAAADAQLYKKVAGTVTNLASGDTGWVANDILMLSLAPNSQILKKNGTTVISSADTALSSAGQTGLFMGNALAAGDSMGSVWQLDNFQYVETGGGTTQPGEGALTVDLTIGAQAAALRAAQAALNADLSIGASGGALRQAQAALSAALVLGADGGALRAAQASLLANITLGADATALRAGQAALDALFNIGAQGNALRVGQAALSAMISIAADGHNTTVAAEAALSAMLSLGLDGNALRAGQAALTLVVNLAAEGRNPSTIVPIWTPLSTSAASWAAVAAVAASWAVKATAAGTWATKSTAGGVWASPAAVAGSWTPRASAV